MRHRTHRLYKRLVAFNTVAALRITDSVGSMWCAYLFVGIGVGALVGNFTGNLWLGLVLGSLSSQVLQLVLLPVILVGQNTQEDRAEKRHHAQEMRLERMEREHGAELKTLHELIADLHSHTTCVGHTTIGEVPPASATTKLTVVRAKRGAQ